MKHITLRALICGINLSLLGCCPAVQCSHSNTIDFYNFSQIDLDKVVVLSYRSDTKLTVLIDSVVTTPGKLTGNEYSSIYLRNVIDGTVDYKIKIINTGQSFTLTDFDIKKLVCRDCFPVGRTHYDGVDGYLLNGQLQARGNIRIYK